MDQAGSHDYPRWRQLVTDAQRALGPLPWPTRLVAWLSGPDVGVEPHEIAVPGLQATLSPSGEVASDDTCVPAGTEPETEIRSLPSESTANTA